MLKRHATDVEVIRRHIDGYTSHGNPTYVETYETVHNVLVNNPSTSDIINKPTNMQGSKIAYTLAFPKTWNKPLKGCFVRIPRIGNDRQFKVIGDPAPVPSDHCPTEWNYTVHIEASNVG